MGWAANGNEYTDKSLSRVKYDLEYNSTSGLYRFKGKPVEVINIMNSVATDVFFDTSSDNDPIWFDSSALSSVYGDTVFFNVNKNKNLVVLNTSISDPCLTKMKSFVNAVDEEYIGWVIEPSSSIDFSSSPSMTTGTRVVNFTTDFTGTPTSTSTVIISIPNNIKVYVSRATDDKIYINVYDKFDGFESANLTIAGTTLDWSVTFNNELFQSLTINSNPISLSLFDSSSSFVNFDIANLDIRDQVDVISELEITDGSSQLFFAPGYPNTDFNQSWDDQVGSIIASSSGTVTPVNVRIV